MKNLLIPFVLAVLVVVSGCKKPDDEQLTPESYITIKGETYALESGYFISQTLDAFYFRDIYLLGGFTNVRIENNLLAMNGAGSGIYFSMISLGSEMESGNWTVGQDSCLVSAFLGKYNPATQSSEYSGKSYEDTDNGHLTLKKSENIHEFDFSFKARVTDESTNQKFENEVVKGHFKGTLTELTP